MTPRYYAIRINAHEPHDSPESARNDAESLPMSEGDEWGILELVGITRRFVTTTWLNKTPSPAPELPASSAMRDLTGTVGKALGAASTPWSWPTLPPGHSYLNPENLTVEQLGDGWRPLCTLDETYPSDHQILLSAGWAPRMPCGFARPYGKGITYRTRAPISALPSNP